MHQFWEIYEMVRLLATILEKQCKASGSAVALACCSKRLGDIVLDSVWEELGDLGRLMRCLPPDTWEMRHGKFVSTTCSSLLALRAYLSSFSYVAPLTRNGSNSRAMLVGYARCIWKVISWTDQGGYQRRFTYYICRPRLWVPILCQTSVPSIGISIHGTRYPSYECS